MSFEKLGLSKPLLRAISDKGYTEPSPIQEKAIPVVLQRKDVLASAQTGTGKTASFTLPILQLLSKQQPQKKRAIRALVLTPTRELAAQILENAEDYGKYLDLRSAVIFGGVKQSKQVEQLRKGVDFLIATPGRLLDLHNQGLISLKQIDILVFDEADRMLDMGFIHDIKKIMALLPRKRQSLLFSATFSAEIKKLAKGFLFHPVTVEATPENTTVELINQKAYRVDKRRKTDLILDMIAGGKWQQVLVFTRTKHGANRLAQKLQKADISAAAIHGNKTQAARVKALAAFKANEIRVLVATDIAARGLDIPLLPHVINFEMPNVSEDYVHRIGRTGRAGANGVAISLVAEDEVVYLRDIEKLIDQPIPCDVIEGFEPTEEATDVGAASKQGQNQQKKPRPKKTEGPKNKKKRRWRPKRKSE